eukprot:gene10533-2751_t
MEADGGGGWWRRMVEADGGGGWWRRMVEADAFKPQGSVPSVPAAALLRELSAARAGTADGAPPPPSSSSSWIRSGAWRPPAPLRPASATGSRRALLTAPPAHYATSQALGQA